MIIILKYLKKFFNLKMNYKKHYKYKYYKYYFDTYINCLHKKNLLYYKYYNYYYNQYLYYYNAYYNCCSNQTNKKTNYLSATITYSNMNTSEWKVNSNYINNFTLSSKNIIVNKITKNKYFHVSSIFNSMILVFLIKK